MRFTDAEAAERLLNRHAREVAKHFENDNLHSAEDVIKISAKKYLERIIKLDKGERSEDE